MRAVQPAAPRVVAASAFGGAAGGDVPPEKPRANLLDGARALDALDDPTAGASDDALRSLPSRGLRALAASDASASSQRGAPVASLDGAGLTRGAAESTPLRGLDAAMPSLRRDGDDTDDDDDDDPLTAAVRDAEAEPETPEAREALNDLPPGKTPSSCLGALLLRFNLFAVIKGTCTVGGGSMIDDLEKLDEKSRSKKSRGIRFYIYKIVLFAVQMALIYGNVCFEDMGISIFRCVFGRYALARILWVGRKTMLDAMKMKLPLLWVPLEIRVEDLRKLPSWVRAAFPRGLYFESTAQILQLLQRSNGLFFDCKCFLWVARSSVAGVAASGTALALTTANVAPRHASRSRALVPSSTAGGSSDAVSSLFSAGVDYAAIDFSSLPTCARRGSALLSSQLGSPLSVSVPYFYIRFHKTNSSKLTDWFLVDDFATVMPELDRKYWDPMPAWVFESKTLRALAAGAALIFRGMNIRDIAPPCSLLKVFDPTVYCESNWTYTIWAGVDFVILLPDGRVLDKRLFLLELLKAHAA